MADRYISEKSLIDEIVKIKDLRTLSTKTIGEAISNVPTADVVEVVRCKDCKYCEHCYPVKAIGEEAVEGWYCKIRKRRMRSDDFCSYGERKEDK
jgi:hypothetical protein